MNWTSEDIEWDGGLVTEFSQHFTDVVSDLLGNVGVVSDDRHPLALGSRLLDQFIGLVQVRRRPGQARISSISAAVFMPGKVRW